MRMYLRVVLLFCISALLFGFVLPPLVSAVDTLQVFAGIVLTLLWLGFVVRYSYKLFLRVYK